MNNFSNHVNAGTIGNPKFDENNQHVQKEKEKSFMKVGSFELDLTYAKSWPGLIRILQIITVTIAFFCCLAGSSSEEWKSNAGIYVFACIILIVAMLISSYTFFNLFAQIRSNECCGYSWMFLELSYFAVFGGLVFLVSCLSANKANGNSNLTASAVFGFISLPTYAASFWILWKVKKKIEDEKEDKNDTNNSVNEPPMDNNFSSNQSLHSQFQDHNNMMMYKDGYASSQIGNRRMSAGRRSRLHSLGRDFYQTNDQKRRFSVSDKDSAFSESLFNSYQDKPGGPMRQRSFSAESLGLHKPFQQRLPSCFDDNQSVQFEPSHYRSNKRRRSAGFPQRLSTNSFMTMPNGHEKAEWGGKYAVDIESQSREIPGWLQAALQDDELDTYDRNHRDPNTDRRNSLRSRDNFTPNHSEMDSFKHQSLLRQPGVRKSYGTMPGLGYDQNLNSDLIEGVHNNHHSLGGRRRSRREMKENYSRDQLSQSQFY